MSGNRASYQPDVQALANTAAPPPGSQGGPSYPTTEENLASPDVQFLLSSDFKVPTAQAPLVLL